VRNNVTPTFAPTVSFKSLTFSDGTTVSLGNSDVVVFVGPNNAGKSAALRELEVYIGPPVKQIIITGVSLHRTGSPQEVRSFLEANAQRRGDAQNLTYQGFGYNISAQALDSWWDSRLDLFRNLMCMRISTETRITFSNKQPSIDTVNESPSHPSHIIYADDRIEQRLSGYFRRAFGKDLIVDRGGGSQIPLMVGGRPTTNPGEDRVSATYLERLRRASKPLDSQGDGMRSFASVILQLLAPSTQSVLLLDEPEAYLHPPQARLLGEFIAKERRADSQLFIATHSADVLQGLLQGAPEQLRMLRIERNGDINRVKELDKEKARAIGSDPLMRFSNVLNGVFHERVIICEADSDCMFYSAMLDLPEIRGEHQPDVLFVHANGKHRMAALAEALRSLGVTVDIIADIDVINDESVHRKIVEALGGIWLTVEDHAKPVRDAIVQHKPWLNSAEVVKAVKDIVKDAPATGEFPKTLQKNIESIFRKASPWDAVKEAGEAAIPSGQPSVHYRELKKLCSAIGLWIVPKGEMEGFCKDIGGHGPRWVQQVIETYNIATASELEAARRFVKEMWHARSARPDVSG
jgi:AAA domain, putative AbiEii toxin, Type IV TA system